VEKESESENKGVKWKRFDINSTNFITNTFNYLWQGLEPQETIRGRSIIYVQTYFDQLFRGHKKQFSDQFLELNNKWMIEIGSNTCDTHISIFFGW
jgi:hypothetical protein